LFTVLRCVVPAAGRAASPPRLEGPRHRKRQI